MMPTEVLLVTAPPGSGRLWDAVSARLRSRGTPVRVFDLFDPVPTDPSFEGVAGRLAAQIEPTTALVGHGAAAPVAWRAAALRAPALLVLSNGPTHRLDPVLAALGRMCVLPGLAAATVLRPAIIQRWLASSAGLRRAVVNPYVMDRDTVVAISEPYLRSPEHRRALATFLHDLARAVEHLPTLDVPVMLIWGEADPLYPPAHADLARRRLHVVADVRIPGGHHMHPVERPWELADAVHAQMGPRPRK